MEELERLEDAPEALGEEPVLTPTPTKREMRRVFSRMALGLCLGLLMSELAPSLLTLVPGFNATAHAFLVGGLCTGCFTLPLMLLLTRPLPALRPERQGVSAGGFLALVSVSYAAMVLGNLVGIAVNSLLSPNSVDLIGGLASSGLTLEVVFSFVVLAPVCEELVFRKVLVDRVLPYGEWPAILFSGVVFGLFHGNLTQLFYAMALGMILAYVYIRTGNVLYTMGIHACLNLLGGVVPLLLPSATYGLMLVSVAGVVVFFALRKRIHVARNAVPGVGGAMFANGGMILFLLISAALMWAVAFIMNHAELFSGMM